MNIEMTNVANGAQQESNTLILVSSEDRIPGESISSFHVPTDPLINNIQALSPISFDGVIFLENINERNNIFSVDGIMYTIPTGNYDAAGLVAAINLLLAGIATVTEVSTIGTAFRFTLTAVGPAFQITFASAPFTRVTGLGLMSAPALSYTGAYTQLLPTLYFDVCAHEIHKGFSDDSSNRNSYGILFRVPVNEIPFVLHDVIVNQQSGKKLIFYPQRTSWPRTTWQLIDEFGLPLLVSPGSSWWVMLKSVYIQTQSL